MTLTTYQGSISEMLMGLSSEPAEKFVVGYASMPNAVVWVRRQGSDLVTAKGEFDPDWAYEVRLFSRHGDLRWRWCETYGQWSILDDAVASNRGWTPLNNDARQRDRLLRGSAQHKGTDGWTRLWDNQSAPFDIPIELAKGERAKLTTIEYVSQDPTHGTAAVVAERYLSLEPWKATKR